MAYSTNRSAGSTARGYGYRWQKAREAYLRLRPLCVMCERALPRRLAPATVVDHIKAHKGNERLFWDQNNWQGLCKPHHDSTKQAQDKGSNVRQIGLDGWPVT